ncbi:unnamed protein product [Rotaria sp. Silwood1]|nr:unnamed protein product [Rotaria sp. Silwood1]CAF3418591.1 unnamed protein product [Rotaria sp. Silwood1]CAF4495123.1 unnamed protein product [Rotaria sp. Silwood1]
MSLGDDDNHDANVLPFADCEIATDVYLDRAISQISKRHNNKKTHKKSNKRQSNDTNNEQYTNLQNTVSCIYFESTEEENNFLKFIPYTGPSNTLHLGRLLYLPQLISHISNDLKISFQRFIQDYDRTIASITPSLETLSLSIYLRFGISYIAKLDIMPDEPMSLRDFTIFRNRGKKLKTSFYTCKGVTSPKRLITTITKLNYHQISSNTYSYEIQLYAIKNNLNTILHFQYDELFHCRSVYSRLDHPINFDFIRDKTSSLFRSIDDSYSDIFDFRIQLSRGKHLSKTDTIVLDVLRGVPIDQVLFLDTSTQILRVSSKLQKFVKYLKCTRSSSYQNVDDQFVINIGTYEEFQLNSRGQCEPLMKSSNTMTIELLDVKTIPSGKKLYDTGMWFSTLCQTCVDLPTTTIEKNSNKSFKWFSGIFVWGRRYNQSIKQMNVNQLTTYRTHQSKQTYTSEELAFIKKILREENLRNILLNTNEEKSYGRKDIDQIFENIMERLKASAAPSANEAMKKVERAYRIVCKEFIES